MHEISSNMIMYVVMTSRLLILASKLPYKLYFPFRLGKAVILLDTYIEGELMVKVG